MDTFPDIMRDPPQVGLPMTVDDLKQINWEDFQNQVCEKIGGRSAQKKIRDMGIDGWTFKGVPIQVKQSESVGRPDVDKFQTAIRRFYTGSSKAKEGVRIVFSFTSDAYNEVSRVKLENGLDISW